MQKIEVPIFEQSLELYKTLHLFRNKIPKQDRFTIWQKSENKVLDLLELLLIASQLPKEEKLPTLEKTSRELNLLRVFLRITKEIKLSTIKNIFIWKQS